MLGVYWHLPSSSTAAKWDFVTCTGRRDTAAWASKGVEPPRSSGYVLCLLACTDACAALVLSMKALETILASHQYNTEEKAERGPYNCLETSSGSVSRGCGQILFSGAQRQGATGTNWRIRSSSWTWRTTSSLWGWQSTRTGYPERLWSLLL